MQNVVCSAVCALLLGVSGAAAGAVAAGVPGGQDVVDAAARYIGVREATGHNDGPAVAVILHAVGLEEGAAWCGALVYKAHADAGLVLPGRPAAYAWSPTWFATASRSVWTLAATRRPGARQGTPGPGDVLGLYFARLGRIGHVGVIEHWDGTTCVSIEGNTNDAGSREGDGVYRKYRKCSTINQVARWHGGN